MLFLTPFDNLPHPLPDWRAISLLQSQTHPTNNCICGQIGLAIGKPDILAPQNFLLSLAIDQRHRGQHIFDFRSIRPGVHPNGPADTAGNTRTKLQTGQFVCRRQTDDPAERRPRLRIDKIIALSAGNKVCLIHTAHPQ